MTGKKATTVDLVLGAEPRMDLLPPEVRTLKKVKATRRRLGGLLVAVLVLVGSGIGASTWYSMQSQAELDAARERTTELLTSQTKYSEVQRVQVALDTTLAARQFGASTEIDWKAYLAEVRALVPSTVTVDTLSVDSASPLVPYEQATAPLQNSRVATIRILFTSPDVTSVPEWLGSMSTLPGYADSQPAVITRTAEGPYTVDFVLHVNEGAFSGRFAPEGQ
ncbi:hypothetical protein GY21_00870 [Cryobacterium roopkundense]|uniref:Fimbrial assembly protein n=1 Tax=Cryobacterium roopkundense TaxID=1001240 RepID=A0A099JY84_9MICO|nr:hypothetical protein [Cryobacterium roopkundense]KGJ82353.1 hypothetical protein GY21_00870 [Cryobacterium roopkundense]MBB5639516.1 hypothetical protein [Cryobacterium roopkundense]